MRTRLLAAAAVVIVLSVYIDAAPRRRAVRPGGGPPVSGPCEVRGLPGFFFSHDRGQTYSENRGARIPSSNWGIAVFSDEPERLFTAVGATFYDSIDGGCTWTSRF